MMGQKWCIVQLYENKSFDKKLKNQMKKGSPSVENTTGASPTSIRNDALITSSPDSDVGILQSKTTSVNKKNGIDHSLDLSTDTENAEVKTEFEGMEDRGWDLPEALENQLIADLESSFVEEDSDGDIYVDGEAKKYAEVSLYAKTKTKGGKVKEKSILETEGRELRDVIRDAFVRGTGNSEQTAYLDEDSAPEDFGDGTITANMTFYGSWDNVKREIGKGTVYFRDKNTWVNIALPVSAMEMENGRTELFAGLRNDDPDYGNFADHSLEQYLGYPSFVRADENFRLYKDNYLPEDTMSDVADYNIERGTRPAGMEEYYPRVSPWVEQSNLDIKNELKDAAAGIVEKWKKDAKLTGGRVLDTKKIKPLVNELVDHCVKLPEYYTASERRACRKIAMDALQNVWYEIQNHENPDLDVIYEILYDAADYIIVNSPVFLVEGDLTESDREAYRFFKQHNRSNPLIIQRSVLDPASNKWIHEPTVAAGPYSWYQAAARNGSMIADSIHPTMKELRQATKGMFSVRYARYGEKSNWESELSDYFAMRGFPELAEAASSGRGVVYEGEQINSAGQAVDMLIREARTLFTSASKGRNTIGLELDADYQDDPQQAREWFKKKFAEDALSLLDKDVKWESVADKWKDKYDTMKNQLKAEHKAEVERVKDRKDGDILRLKEKSARLVNREKWKASFRIKELKAKERAKKEERKEKEKRKKYVEKINDKYKWFTDRLQKKERALEKNIPEVLRQPLANALAVMDIQSKGSVKAEERNIKKFGTSIKSAQALHVLHSTLVSLAENGEMFSDVNQDIFALNPVISDALGAIKGTCEGKPLRDMTSEELMNVNKLLSAIKHEIVDGNNVILDGRKQEISEVQNSVIKETQRNITRRGKAKTYKDTDTGETRELLHKIKSFDFVE